MLTISGCLTLGSMASLLPTVVASGTHPPTARMRFLSWRDMAHEDLSREQHVESSSDRAFGLVFAAAFGLVCLWPLLHREPPRWWALAPAILLALVALTRPVLLAGLNRLWIKLGLLLGKIVSPIALGIVFYCVVAPIGTLARLTGKDPLRLKLDPRADSYWIPAEAAWAPAGFHEPTNFRRLSWICLRRFGRSCAHARNTGYGQYS